MKDITDNLLSDKEILTSIVKEMAESMTGAQSTMHWAEDVLWFDIPPFASRGVQPASKCSIAYLVVSVRVTSIFAKWMSC